jgi:hypothetical protein
VRAVKGMLDAAGWTHTYDWTVHGSVQKCGTERIAEVAKAETLGVMKADVVIVLLPGGRGTHVEIGLALANLWACGSRPEDQDILICLYSPNPDEDFGTTGKTCAFYHYPNVQKFTDLDEMIGYLLSE